MISKTNSVQREKKNIEEEHPFDIFNSYSWMP